MSLFYFFLLLLIWDREGVQQTNSSNYFIWKSPDLLIQVGGENCIKDLFINFEIGIFLWWILNARMTKFKIIHIWLVDWRKFNRNSWSLILFLSLKIRQTIQHIYIYIYNYSVFIYKTSWYVSCLKIHYKLVKGDCRITHKKLYQARKIKQWIKQPSRKV